MKQKEGRSFSLGGRRECEGALSWSLKDEQDFEEKPRKDKSGMEQHVLGQGDRTAPISLTPGCPSLCFRGKPAGI